MPAMRRAGHWGAILWIVLAALCVPASAAPPRSLHFTTFSVEHGLTQQSVIAIIQDRQGYVWLGTQAGLTRYDGYRVVAFRNRPGDPGSLTDNYITALHEDRAGRLWVGTRGGGVMRYDPARRAFVRYPPAPAGGVPGNGSGSLMIRAILGDAPARAGAGERLWVATAQGLQRLDPDTGVFETWRHDPRRAGSLASDNVLSLARDRRGRLWVGTGAGLDRLDAPGQRFLHFRLDSAVAPDPKHNTILALAVDRRGRLWVGTSVALESWQVEGGASRRRRLATDTGGDSGPVRAILQDRDGVLWFGTGTGLLRHDADAGTVVGYRHAARDPHSLIDDDIDALYQDRSGTLWVGTHNNGTSRVDLGSGGFERIIGLGGANGGRDDDKVYAIDSTGDAEVWIGTLGGGLQRLDRRTGQVTAYRHDPADPRSLPNNLVRAVHVDPDGTVWAATENGLARLAPGAAHFDVRHFGDGDPLLDNLRQVHRDRTGALWIGTEAGVHRYDPATGAVRTFRNDPRDAGSLGLGRVFAVVEDRDGALWIGSDSGLSRWDAASGRFANFRHDPARPDSLSHNRVTYVFEDRAGHLWIGSAGGLDRFEPDAAGGGRFRRIARNGGQAIDPVGAILEDDAGRLWISTTAGITRFDPASGEVRNYGARDGLIDGSYYVGSGHAAEDGTFFFGGISGLTAFRPDAIRDNAVPPRVVITELQVFNRPVLGDARPEGVRFAGTIETARELTLSHRNAVFALEFAALHFADPERNRYAYRLDGFDPDWVQADASRRFATYTNLDPGRYTFRVKAANKDGVWSGPGATLAIVIEPPFWATWWFRTLAALALLGLVVGIYRLRVRGLHQQQARLAAEVQARTAEVVRQKEDIEQAHATLAKLGEIGREITATLDEATLFRTLDRHVHGLLDAPSCSIYILDPDGQGLTSALRVEGGETLPVARVAIDDPEQAAARCARERRELHMVLPPDDTRHFPGTLRTRSGLFAPLAIGDRLLGVMTIQSLDPDAYGERERLVFRTLCAYGAIALDNAVAYRRLADVDAEVQRMLREQQAWLEHEVEARTAEIVRQKADIEQAHATLSVLGEIGREITAVLVEEEVCRTLDRHVHGLLDANTFAIYLLDADGQGLTSALRVEDGAALPVARIAMDNPTRIAARCARERQELVLDQRPDEDRPSHVPGTAMSLSMLFAPLVVGERLLGVMTIQSPRAHAYGERERLVFRTLCAYGAIALDNAGAYRRLADADAEVQRVLRERQQWLEQEVQARTSEVVAQKEGLEQAHATLSVLGEIGREITATLDVAAVVATLDRHVHALLDATTIGIYRLDADAAVLESLLLKEGGQPLPTDRIALADPNRHAAHCARDQCELMPDQAEDEEDPSHVPGTLVTLSALFAPLAIGDRLLGVMTIQSPRRHAYGERERLVFRTLCAYGAIALDNAVATLRLRETEEQLQRLAREQRLILDNAAASVFMVRDRVIERCNRGMEEMLGYGPGELVGKSTEVYHVSHESWVAQGERVYGQISAGEVAEGELEIVRKDGRHIWITYRGRAVDPHDLAQGSIWVSTDITERKRTEAELERIRRELQVIFDHSAGGGILLTRDRTVVRASPGLERILGYAPGETAGKPIRENFRSDEAYVAFGAWAYPLMAAGGTATGEVEYIGRHGEAIQMYVSGTAIDPADLSQGVVWMAHDIRKQKQEAAELDRARRELQIIFDNNIGAIAVVREGRIERCSRGFLAMYGYAADEAVGMPIEAFATSREASEALGQLTTPDLRSGKVVSGEFEYRRKDGSTGWLVYQGRALEPPDLEQGTIWLCQDISNLKGHESALLSSKRQVERSLVEVEQLNRQVTMLGEMTGFLQACPSADEAFSCIGEFGPRLFADSVGVLYLADEDGRAWVEHGRWGTPTGAVADRFAGGDCWALRRSRAYRVEAQTGALCCPHVAPRDGAHRPYACLPLTAQGKTFGLLHIEYDGEAHGDAAERRHGVAVAMAEQIALAIANVQLREALLQQSIRDPLTGLYNRRYLQEALFREMAHAKRNHATFAVLMIDVDHFKKFNDTFGHHAGDAVLQAVAKTIEAQFRRSDVACRFGGEEFTVLLPGTDMELAQRLAHGVLEGIRELVLHHDGKALDRITASLGVALFPDHGGTPQALIEAADAALYAAKEAGRNRVIVSGAAAG